jgi:hypothetical protein
VEVAWNVGEAWAPGMTSRITIRASSPIEKNR